MYTPDHSYTAVRLNRYKYSTKSAIKNNGLNIDSLGFPVSGGHCTAAIPEEPSDNYRRLSFLLRYILLFFAYLVSVLNLLILYISVHHLVFGLAELTPAVGNHYNGATDRQHRGQQV